jgi:hypothetical protein
MHFTSGGVTKLENVAHSADFYFFFRLAAFFFSGLTFMTARMMSSKLLGGLFAFVFNAQKCVGKSIKTQSSKCQQI